MIHGWLLSDQCDNGYWYWVLGFWSVLVLGIVKGFSKVLGIGIGFKFLVLSISGPVTVTRWMHPLPRGGGGGLCALRPQISAYVGSLNPPLPGQVFPFKNALSYQGASYVVQSGYTIKLYLFFMI